MSCFMSNLLNTNFMKCYIRSNRSMIRWKNRASVCSTNWVTCDQAGVPCANGNGKHTVTPASTRCRHMNININIYIYVYDYTMDSDNIIYMRCMWYVCVTSVQIFTHRHQTLLPLSWESRHPCASTASCSVHVFFVFLSQSDSAGKDMERQLLQNMHLGHSGSKIRSKIHGPTGKGLTNQSFN